MIQNLNLSITNPCSEKWDNFTSTTHGGFCHTCSKVVIDFTKMSDDEIIEYFNENKARTCGRFRPDQLKNYSLIHVHEIKPGMTLLKAGIAALLLFFLNGQTHAQTTGKKPKTEIAVDAANTLAQDTTIEGDKNFAGVVKLREDGSTLPGVNVMLKGSAIGTVTDAEGRFEFPQKLKPNDVLIFAFIGLKSKEFTITSKTKFGTEIPMEMCMDIVIMGEVAVAGVYHREPRSFRRWWSRIKAAF